jgi:hypothetical protein
MMADSLLELKLEALSSFLGWSDNLQKGIRTLNMVLATIDGLDARCSE